MFNANNNLKLRQPVAVLPFPDNMIQKQKEQF